MESTLWQLVCASSSPHVTALSAWEPGEKVIRSVRRLDNARRQDQANCSRRQDILDIARYISFLTHRACCYRRLAVVLRDVLSNTYLECCLQNIAHCIANHLERWAGAQSYPRRTWLSCSLRCLRGHHGMPMLGQ